MGYRRWKDGFRVRARPRRRLGRLGDILLFCLLASVTVYAIARFLPEAERSGRAFAIDGDSLRVDGVEFRLRGIDAPEAKQTCRDRDGAEWPCGIDATLTLKRLVRGARVTCRGDETDRYGRRLASCTVGDIELNAEMVRLGFAVARDQNGLPYLLQQVEARRAARGIWRGKFEHPSDWRATHDGG